MALSGENRCKLLMIAVHITLPCRAANSLLCCWSKQRMQNAKSNMRALHRMDGEGLRSLKAPLCAFAGDPGDGQRERGERRGGMGGRRRVAHRMDDDHLRLTHATFKVGLGPRTELSPCHVVAHGENMMRKHTF